MSDYPSLETLISDQVGEELLKLNRSYLSILTYIVALIFATAMIFNLELLIYKYDLLDRFPILSKIPYRWLSIIPIGLLLEVLRRWKNDLYVFGLHNLTHFGGRLSLNYAVPVIKYMDIRGITVKQGIVARILNYGDIAIGTAAADGNELVLVGVDNPSQLVELIEELRTNSEKILKRKNRKASPDLAANVSQTLGD